MNETARFAYTLHLHDPNATAVEYAGRENNQVIVYPNPSGTLQYLEFKIDKPVEVAVTLLDYSGRVIRDIYSGKVEESQKIEVDFSGIAYGIYFYRIRMNDQVIIKRYVKH